jgi:hypothetical protein
MWRAKMFIRLVSEWKLILRYLVVAKALLPHLNVEASGS